MNKFYAGISGIALTEDMFDLGHGITIRKTFAHLFSPIMMAFKPPGKHGHHEGPWKTAKGGYGYDIFAELEIPEILELKEKFSEEEIAWIIGVMFRISFFPFMSLPALSTLSFSNAVDNTEEPVITPFETVPRMFKFADRSIDILQKRDADWIKENWKKVALMMKKNENFFAVMKAYDTATLKGNISTSLLTLWAAIEQLFSVDKYELRFRVSAHLACYLEERGDERMALVKKLQKLYDQRSIAAHTTKKVSFEPLIESMIYFRNALMKMIEVGAVPTKEDFDKLLFA